MTLTTTKVTLMATVNRAAWQANYGEEPEAGLPAYVLDAVQQGADRLVELGARVYQAEAGPEFPDHREAWPSVRVTLIVEVDGDAWRRHYGRSAKTTVPPYVAHVVWLTTAFTKDNGTVELIAAS